MHSCKEGYVKDLKGKLRSSRCLCTFLPAPHVHWDHLLTRVAWGCPEWSGAGVGPALSSSRSPQVEAEHQREKTAHVQPCTKSQDGQRSF